MLRDPARSRDGGAVVSACGPPHLEVNIGELHHRHRWHHLLGARALSSETMRSPLAGGGHPAVTSSARAKEGRHASIFRSWNTQLRLFLPIWAVFTSLLALGVCIYIVAGTWRLCGPPGAGFGR